VLRKLGIVGNASERVLDDLSAFNEWHRRAP
jgi:hypothetical protein